MRNTHGIDMGAAVTAARQKAFEEIEFNLDRARSALVAAANEADKGSLHELSRKYIYSAAQLTREIEALKTL